MTRGSQKPKAVELTLEQCLRVGALLLTPNPHTAENSHTISTSENLTTNVLLLIGSLTNNLNSQLIDTLYMNIVYTYNKVSWGKENVFLNCCKSQKSFPMYLLKKVCI